MMPGEFDLDLYADDTVTWRFVLWEDETKTVAVDLTGATVAAQIRDKPDGLLITALDTVITMPNIIDVFLTMAIWDDPNTQWPAKGKGAWDLEVIFPTNERRTFVAGNVNIRPDVTDLS